MIDQIIMNCLHLFFVTHALGYDLIHYSKSSIKYFLALCIISGSVTVYKRVLNAV